MTDHKLRGPADFSVLFAAALFTLGVLFAAFTAGFIVGLMQ